jgi:hypothetical protein
VKNDYSKSTIDAAAQLYIKGVPGGWNTVAEQLNKQGYTRLNGGLIHGKSLCVWVLKDPAWQHLRKHKKFSVSKRLIIAKAIEAYKGQTIDDIVLLNIMKKIP